MLGCASACVAVADGLGRSPNVVAWQAAARRCRTGESWMRGEGGGGEVRVGEGSKDGSWEILATDPSEVQLDVLSHGENVWVVSKHLPVPLGFQ